MSTNLGFVTNPAKGDTDKLAVHCAGNGLPDGGFSNSRRSDQTEYRSLGRLLTVPQLQYSKKLQYTFFDIFQPVMILFEYLSGDCTIEPVLGEFTPRTVKKPIHISKTYVEFRC